MIQAQALSKNRTINGSIELTDEIVRFTAGTSQAASRPYPAAVGVPDLSGNETVEMPISGLKISRGGFNNEQFFLEHNDTGAGTY